MIQPVPKGALTWRVLGDLKNTAEHGQSLLDRTMVLYGSNLGNANSHDNKNMPILLDGGGFKHGQYTGIGSVATATRVAPRLRTVAT